MNNVEIISKNSQETFDFGKIIGTKLIENDFASSMALLLFGPMGSGKTEFTKGVARGLGIAQTILSPTYTLAREYLFSKNAQKYIFLHADLWRMQSSKEIDDINLNIFKESKGIVVIEWADQYEKQLMEKLSELKVKILEGHFTYGNELNERKITMVEL